MYTNALLPYATTQMTAHGMDQRYAALMAPDSVAPVAAALVHPRSQINGATVVAGANGVRYAETSEGMTVTFAEAQDAFQSLAADLA